MRDNAGMPPDLMVLFLLAGAFNVVTIAVVMYVGFPRPETCVILVVTLLLIYVVLTLAPVVFLPPMVRPCYIRNTSTHGSNEPSP